MVIVISPREKDGVALGRFGPRVPRNGTSEGDPLSILLDTVPWLDSVFTTFF